MMNATPPAGRGKEADYIYNSSAPNGAGVGDGDAILGNDDQERGNDAMMILPRSQPDPMMTPASPADARRRRLQQQQQQQHAPGSAGLNENRYADYLAEVAGASDVGTPGKSPRILSAPTYDEDDNGNNGINGDEGGNARVLTSPLVAAAAAAAETVARTNENNDNDISILRDGSGDLGSRSIADDDDSADGITMDVSAPPAAAAFPAGFVPPSARPPAGIGGRTNATSVSGISGLASGIDSSISTSASEDEEEETEEVMVSSDSADDGSPSETGTPPLPLQQERRSAPLPPSSAPLARGPLSPFSPDGRRARTEIRTRLQSPSSRWSLRPCRKVSVLVRVKPPGSNWDDAERASSPSKGRSLGIRSSTDDESSASAQLSVFPLLPPGAECMPPGAEDAPAARLLSLASELSSSASSGASQAANSLVVVNPTAFGTRIPLDLTMETARLVAEVGNIDSEDWARRYRFDDVLWPDVDCTASTTTKSGSDVGAGRSDGSLLIVARAMVLDALRLTPRSPATLSSEASRSESSSILCTFGSAGSGRSYTAFGRSCLRGASGRRRAAASTVVDESAGTFVLDRTGVLGLLVAELLGYSRSKPVEFTVSLLEVVDDDLLRDLFRPPNAEFDLGQPRIRHPDHHGAIVQNMTEMSFSSVKELEETLREALVPSSVASACRGHIIASIKIRCSTSISDSGKGWNHSVIQVVDLSPGDDSEVAGASSPSVSFDAAQKRHAASIRKSLSGLRGILRGLIVQEAQRSISHNLSYRECTLTKLLQRALDSAHSRAVLIACIDPRKDSYQRTIQTLNYVNRLWIKPGITAQSPFEAIVKGEGVGRTSTARTLFPSSDERDSSETGRSGKEASDDLLKRLRASAASADPSVLTSIVSDPRQRVATLLASSSKLPAPRESSDVHESATPWRRAGPLKPAPSSSTNGTDDAGTFDSVLEKLDALEASPTYSHRDIMERSSIEDATTSAVASTTVEESAEGGAPERMAFGSDNEVKKPQRMRDELLEDRKQAQQNSGHVAKQMLPLVTERGSADGSQTSSSSSSVGQFVAELRAAQVALDGYNVPLQRRDLREGEVSSEKEVSHSLNSGAQLPIDCSRQNRLLQHKLGGEPNAEQHKAENFESKEEAYSSSHLSLSDRALPLEDERKGGWKESKDKLPKVELEEATHSEEQLQKVHVQAESSSTKSSSASEAELKHDYEVLLKEKDAIADELKRHVAKEEARLLKSSSTSHTSSTEGELAGQLSATSEVFEDHKVEAFREKRQLEHDKTALRARHATVIDQDIRTSDDVVGALREELEQSYSTAKAVEEKHSDEREGLLKRITDLKGDLEQAQCAQRGDVRPRFEKEVELRRELNVLLAEKEVSDRKAVSNQRELQAKVDALEAEVKAANSAKLLAEGELKQVKDSSSRSSASGSEWEMASETDMMAESAEIEKCLHMSSDKKDLAEKALQEVLRSGISSSSEAGEAEDALQDRVAELEAERKAAMFNFGELQKRTEGGHNFQDELNHLRNTQMQSLIEEIESLGRAVEDLTNLNRELQDSQALNQRIIEEGFAISTTVDGNGSPHLDDQVKSLTSQIEMLKHRLTQALEGEEQSKAAEKSDREEVLGLQARMDKTLVELKSLESPSLSSMDRLKKERAVALEQAMSSIAGKDEELSSLRSKLQQSETDNASLRSGFSGEQSTVKGDVPWLQKTTTEYLAKIDELSKDLSATRRSLIDNQEESMDVMAQYEALRLEKEETDHSLRQSRARIKELEQNIQAMKGRTDIALSHHKKEALSAEDQLQKRVMVTEHAHAERVSVLQRQVDTVSKAREQLHQKNEDLVEQLAVEKHARYQHDADVERVIATLQSEVDAATEELTSVKSRALSLREDRDKVEEGLRYKLDTLNEERSAMREESLALEGDNRNLRGQIFSLQSEIQGLNEVLLKSKNEYEALLEQLDATRTHAAREATTNQKDSELNAKLRRENSALKKSIKQCDAAMEAMRKEVSELRSTADFAMKRLESKKESSETRLRKDVYELEQALAAARTEANSARSEAAAADRERLESEVSLRGAASELEDLNLDLQETDERLRAVIRDNESLKEENNELRRASNRKSETGSAPRSRAYDEGEVFAKLHRERALRRKAEEIAVALAQQMKAGMSNNDLDSELRRLMTPDECVGSHLLAVTTNEAEEDRSSTPPYSSRHSQAVEELDKLKPVVRNLESLYEMKDRSVRDLESSLAATTSELKKYKRMALRLQNQDDGSNASGRAGTSRPADAGEEGVHTSYRSRNSGRQSHSSGAAYPWRREDRLA